jgi:hypothetical protein
MNAGGPTGRGLGRLERAADAQTNSKLVLRPGQNQTRMRSPTAGSCPMVDPHQSGREPAPRRSSKIIVCVASPSRGGLQTHDQRATGVRLALGVTLVTATHELAPRVGQGVVDALIDQLGAADSYDNAAVQVVERCYRRPLGHRVRVVELPEV